MSRGTEAGDSSTFSQITAGVTIQREGGRLFATLFIGFFVATVLILMILIANMAQRLQPVIALEVRITLGLGAIFATLGSIFNFVNEMPYTTRFTLADSLLLTTSLGIVTGITSALLIARLRGTC